jgi:signal transduction histidine kinase
MVAAQSAMPIEDRARARVTKVAVLTTAGVLAAAASAWFVASSSVLTQPVATGILRGLYVAAYVGAGLYTWWRRPDSTLGPLVAGLGFIFALTSLNSSPNALTYTLGMTIWAAYVVYNAYVYLCFPRGRLESRRETGWFSALALSSVVLWTAILLFAQQLPAGAVWADCADRCPDNAFQIVETSDRVSDGLAVVYGAATTIALLGIAALIVGKARSPSRLRRRALAPLGYAVVGVIASFVLYRVLGTALPGAKEELRIPAAVFALFIPAAIVIGQFRGRMFTAGRIGQLAVAAHGSSATPTRIQELMRDALGDPTLVLALAAPAGTGAFVDASGARIELPRHEADRTATPVVRDGDTVAAVIHDPLLDADSALVEGIAATSFMLLENTRLVEELRASRGRIASAAEHERLRLERDLHDGAQQRLMAIQVKLALLRDQVTTEELAGAVDEISDDASAAVEELRGLAHGIYPTVLRERGLADGLRATAATSPVPLEVVDRGVGRCDPTVEAAVYFACLEAIQNATKHAGTGARVVVTLDRAADKLEFSILDDGAGFEAAAPTDGIGLVSMRDRIAAVGGDLEVRSGPGSGTAIRGSVCVG